jgi:hypothetical protein
MPLEDLYNAHKVNFIDGRKDDSRMADYSYYSGLRRRARNLDLADFKPRERACWVQYRKQTAGVPGAPLEHLTSSLPADLYGV